MAAWLMCPWCGGSAKWTLPLAVEAAQAMLRAAGLNSLVETTTVRYTQEESSYVLDGSKTICLKVEHIQGDRFLAKHLERARRALGRENYFALDHPLHVLLHEYGHVFEQHLRLRERNRLGAVFGDLSKPYLVSKMDYRRVVYQAKHPHIFSAYAQLHPSEAFAEAFAVHVFHVGANRPIGEWLRERGKSVHVRNALLAMSSVVLQHMEPRTEA